MMPDVRIRVIPPKEHRYQTVGDWQAVTMDLVEIRVSEMTADSEFLVALHELVEWYLCRRRGVSEADVDAFDATPLDERYDEHGDDPRAPYHREHELAGIIERLVAHAIGVDWYEHAEAVEAADEAWAAT